MVHNIFNNVKMGIGQGPKEHLNFAFGQCGIRVPAKTRYSDR